MMVDRERLRKAIAYLNSLWFDYQIKDDLTHKRKKYSKFTETYNKMKVRNAITLLQNTTIMKANLNCPECRGTGKVVVICKCQQVK